MAKINLENKTYIAIDLGTSKTRVYIDNLGIVFNEATAFAEDTKTKKIIALGDEANKFIGKTNGSITVKTPLKKGAISNIADLKRYIDLIFAKYPKDVKGSVITLACPVGVTKIEREALIKSVLQSGPSYVNVEDDIKLSLIGAGYDIYKSDSAVLCLDIGAGKTTCGIIFAGETMVSHWIKTAGETIDQNIIKIMKEKYNLMVGEKSAEKLKHEVGSIIKSNNVLKSTVYGYDLMTSTPKQIVVTEKDISKAIVSVFNSTANLVTHVLEQAPHEIAGDVIRNSMIVTGGSASIVGVKFFFENFFEIPVKVAKNCSTTVIDGALAIKKQTYAKIEDEHNN